MRSRSLKLLISTIVVSAALPASGAMAAALPEITRVTPRVLQINEKLTITGKNFRSGPLKTTVAFYRKGYPVVFIKAEKASKTKLTVTVTQKVLTLFKDDYTKPRLIRLKILTTKLGRRWTTNSRSVTIDPFIKEIDPGGGGGTSTNAPATLTCEQRAAGNPGNDEDSDLVGNLLERTWGLDPCKNDTDADGITDGFEVWSAIELNGLHRDKITELGSTAVPSTIFNGRQPWPNPVDNKDPGKDFDGDGLSLAQEYALWVAGGSPYPGFNYLDGNQQTVAQNASVFDPGDTNPADGVRFDPLDRNFDGILTDDEKDFDGDGLSNIVEFNLEGTQKWWDTVKWLKPRGSEFINELPYSWRTFTDVDATRADSDGDGVFDGRDDQDNDGISNFTEMQRGRISIAAGGDGMRVHAFNPCLPDLWAVSCGRYPLLAGKTHPPYDGTVDEDPTVQVDSPLPGYQDGDYVIVRWPWNSTDVPDFSNFTNPVNTTINNAYQTKATTLWDGQTGLRAP